LSDLAPDEDTSLVGLADLEDDLDLAGLRLRVGISPLSIF